MDTENPNNLL